jgi:hypothetical protein
MTIRRRWRPAPPGIGWTRPSHLIARVVAPEAALRSIVSVLLAVAAIALAGPAAADEVKIFEQAPCELSKDTCVAVSPSRLKTGTLRSFSFTAPAAGVATITFNGTMTCANTQVGTFGAVGGFDFETQITTQSSLIPDYNEASGARWAGQLPSATTAISPSQSVNVASTRRISFKSGGKKTVYMRYLINRLDQGLTCSVWSAGFSVLYVSN